MDCDVLPPPGDVVRRLLQELVPVTLLSAAEDGLHTQLLHSLSEETQLIRRRQMWTPTWTRS